MCEDQSLKVTLQFKDFRAQKNLPNIDKNFYDVGMPVLPIHSTKITK